MQRTGRELTDVEMIDLFFEIVQIMLDAYNKPLRPDFEKRSRTAQAGYDIMILLHKKGIIAPGEAQGKLKL